MRDPKRIKNILNLLEKLWNKNPDQRLGQLLENYVFTQGIRGDKTSVKLFYQEDDETILILRKQLNPVKEDCQGYFLCLTDLDWRPEHCIDCLQYIPPKPKPL